MILYVGVDSTGGWGGGGGEGLMTPGIAAVG